MCKFIQYKLLYTNSYWSTIGRHGKKTLKFWKKGVPLKPRYAGMCTFSPKKLRHWCMQFKTPTRTISFLYQYTVWDLRLIRIHFHAISQPHSIYSRKKRLFLGKRQQAQQICLSFLWILLVRKWALVVTRGVYMPIYIVTECTHSQRRPL
jgi:hypothetical protein